MELAKDCVRTCHVLRNATEVVGVENLSDPSRKQAEELGRCVNCINLPQPPLLATTNGIRIVRHIESIVSERENCASALRERHPGSPKECISTWRTEMWKILEIFDVSRPQSTTHLRFLNYSSGGPSARRCPRGRQTPFPIARISRWGSRSWRRRRATCAH